MISRDELTKIFLQQWGKSTDDVNVKLYSRQWWKSNQATKPSFRLSNEGLLFLTNTLNLTCYEVSFEKKNEINSQFLVHLAKYIDSPYYLTNTSIIVFSEKLSIELSLIDDIQKFGLRKDAKNKPFLN